MLITPIEEDYNYERVTESSHVHERHCHLTRTNEVAFVHLPA